MYNPGGSDSMARARVSDRMKAADRPDRHDKGIERALASVALFSQCSKRELRLVAKLAKTRPVKAGTTLITEGEPGESLYVVLAGHAYVSKDAIKIAEIGPGDVVGELAILSKAPRNATVTLTADGEVATISRRDVYRLIEDAPGFARKLLEALAERVRDLDDNITY